MVSKNQRPVVIAAAAMVIATVVTLFGLNFLVERISRISPPSYDKKAAFRRQPGRIGTDDAIDPQHRPRMERPGLGMDDQAPPEAMPDPRGGYGQGPRRLRQGKDAPDLKRMPPPPSKDDAMNNGRPAYPQGMQGPPPVPSPAEREQMQQEMLRQQQLQQQLQQQQQQQQYYPPPENYPSTPPYYGPPPGYEDPYNYPSPEDMYEYENDYPEAPPFPYYDYGYDIEGKQDNLNVKKDTQFAHEKIEDIEDDTDDIFDEYLSDDD